MKFAPSLFVSLILCLAPISGVSISAHAATQSEIEEAIELLRNSSSGLVDSYNDTEVKQILRDEGYGSVRIIEQGEVRFKADGKVYVLYIHKDGDMHLYFGSTDMNLNFENINEWNRTTRLSRAYLDEEMHTALETDLLANAGINKEMIIEMIKVFIQTSVPRFIEFAKENSQN
ncbi:YbjN domain-containing protein [Amphritea balenae]|uniref:YbjN domain-containing protein n=1 Tax=Amphritea balenae TaxID=452629 RepID=A0A3P1SUR3_9GAMM|nr:YbjN domain-containing protein [Amphritea balenae]RRC99892.1 YbjN domain-containing protein [Amphritea balenae]GGK74879.1 hypothetical protein GCM10007941_26160 [Amphritea balenae]